MHVFYGTLCKVGGGDGFMLFMKLYCGHVDSFARFPPEYKQMD